MVVFSKECSPFSCYEVGHTWTPFCPSAAAGVGLSCFEEGIKIYSSVYLVCFFLYATDHLHSYFYHYQLSALLSGKIPDIGQLKRILSSILQSSFFLGCNGFCFISAFCICRYFTGHEFPTCIYI